MANQGLIQKQTSDLLVRPCDMLSQIGIMVALRSDHILNLPSFKTKLIRLNYEAKNLDHPCITEQISFVFLLDTDIQSYLKYMMDDRLSETAKDAGLICIPLNQVGGDLEIKGDLNELFELLDIGYVDFNNSFDQIDDSLNSLSSTLVALILQPRLLEQIGNGMKKVILPGIIWRGHNGQIKRVVVYHNGYGTLITDLVSERLIDDSYCCPRFK